MPVLAAALLPVEMMATVTATDLEPDLIATALLLLPASATDLEQGLVGIAPGGGGANRGAAAVPNSGARPRAKGGAAVHPRKQRRLAPMDLGRRARAEVGERGGRPVGPVRSLFVAHHRGEALEEETERRTERKPMKGRSQL
jgi:hypothetical protein